MWTSCGHMNAQLLWQAPLSAWQSPKWRGGGNTTYDLQIQYAWGRRWNSNAIEIQFKFARRHHRRERLPNKFEFNIPTSVKKKKKNFSLGDENSVGKKKRSGRRWFQPLMVRKIKIKQNLCKTRRLWRVVGMNALHSLQNAFASIPFVRIVVMSIAAAPRAFMWFNCIYCYFIFTTSKFGKTAPKYVSRKHISFRVCLQFRRSKGGRFKKGGGRG